MRKTAAYAITLLLGAALFTGCGDKSGSENLKEVTVRVGGMSGPTSMGLVKLMEEAENNETANQYEFADLSTDAAAFVAPLTSGEIDIAALPSNLASVIYNNTNGGVKLLAVNTLGVLNIVERKDTIADISDLAGKKLYATGQGAIPEYTLRYLLNENGINPDSDLTIQWCADTTEALSYVVADEEAVAMLPQPFATAAAAKAEGLHVALDLNEEWKKVNADCEIVTGVLAVRSEFAEQHPKQVEAFLKEYKASVEYTQKDAAGAAALIEKYGIVPAAVAEKALPGCHITYLTGSDMKKALAGYYEILFSENPTSLGGALPADDFYYGM